MAEKTKVLTATLRAKESEVEDKLTSALEAQKAYEAKKTELAAFQTKVKEEQEEKTTRKKQVALHSFFKPVKQEVKEEEDKPIFPEEITGVRKKRMTVAEARKQLRQSEFGRSLLQQASQEKQAELDFREKQKQLRQAQRQQDALALKEAKWKAKLERPEEQVKKEQGEDPKSLREVEAGIHRAELQQKVRKTLGDGQKRMRQEPVPLARKKLTEQLDARMKEPGPKGKEFWQEVEKDFLCSKNYVLQLLSKEGRAETERRLKRCRGQGRHRYWMTLLRGEGRGSRKERSEDTKGGFLRDLKQDVKAWADQQIRMGHDLSAADLLAELKDRAEDLVWRLEGKARREAGEQAAASGKDVSEEDQKLAEEAYLDIMEKHKLKASRDLLSNCTRQARHWQQEALLRFCDLVERESDLTFPMSPEESRLVCFLSWQSFDRIVHLLCYGNLDTLAEFCADPLLLQQQRENIPVVGSDAVPVYLDTSTGKVLVSGDVITAQAKRNLAKRLNLPTEEVPDKMHLTAEGESRQDKNRLTWVQRWACYNYFQRPGPGKQPKRIKGEILRSILMVHCNQPVRLELICPHTDTWLQDHHVSRERESDLNGLKLQQRDQGSRQNIPLTLTPLLLYTQGCP